MRSLRMFPACVRLSLIAGALICAGFSIGRAAEPTASTLPHIAAYRWGAANPHGGAHANEAFAKWLGVPTVWAEDFMPIERWDGIEGPDWSFNEWSAWKKANPDRKFILSVPILVGPWDRSGPKDGESKDKPVSLAAGARGEYNAHYLKLAQNLVRRGLADSILRLGWEFNGGWYTWRAAEDPAAFAGYWQQIVQTMRSVKGAEGLTFCWNPAVGVQQFESEKAWPGDAYVDYVGLDVYDDSWAPDTYPLPKEADAAEIARRRTKAWNEVLFGGPHGLKFWSDFAREHHKPMAIPEWGVDARSDGHGGMDDPDFIRRMHDFIVAPENHVALHCYFDVSAPDGDHQLSPGSDDTESTHAPRSAAEFKKLFGEAKEQ